MTITVTDLGINQKTSALEKLGAKAIQWVLGRLKDEARIAVVMPDPKQVTGKTNQELRHQIFQNLKERVDRALKDGHEQIEIQLVQDINAFGYVSLFPFEDRQHQVDQFGEAAYGAIADITAYLRQNNVQTHNHAILGSNGAKVFAHNVAAWSLNGKSIWEKVDFFDGRAHLTSIVMAITRIGADRVRIFNTAGDLWAPFTAWGFQSIGNRNTSRLLVDEYFPQLKVYELKPIRINQSISHISGTDDENLFAVHQYTKTSGSMLLLSEVSGRSLRNPLPAANPPSQPLADPQGITVWRNAVEDITSAFKSFARDYKARTESLKTVYGYESTRRNQKGVHVLSTIYRLESALMHDLEASHANGVVTLSPHTLKEIFSITLESIAAHDNASPSQLNRLAKHYVRFQEFYDMAAKIAQTGKVDVDTMKAFDSGVIALIKEQKLSTSLRIQQALKARLVAEKEFAIAKKALDEYQFKVWKGSPNKLGQGMELSELRRLRINFEQGERKVMQALGNYRRQVNVLMLLDFLPDLAAGLAEHARTGRLTMDVANRYSDALVFLSASCIAIAISTIPGLGAFAPTIRDLLVAGFRYQRDEVVRQTARNVESKFELLEEYQQYLLTALHAKEVIRTFAEYHGNATLKRRGWKESESRAIDKEYEGIRVHHEISLNGTKSRGVGRVTLDDKATHREALRGSERSRSHRDPDGSLRQEDAQVIRARKEGLDRYQEYRRSAHLSGAVARMLDEFYAVKELEEMDVSSFEVELENALTHAFNTSVGMMRETVLLRANQSGRSVAPPVSIRVKEPEELRAPEHPTLRPLKITVPSLPGPGRGQGPAGIGKGGPPDDGSPNAKRDGGGDEPPPGPGRAHQGVTVNTWIQYEAIPSSGVQSIGERTP